MGFQLESSTVWLILLVAMVLIEIFTLGLTTIWFAGGAMAGFLASLLGAGIPVQVILFLAVSFVLLLLVRPLARNRFNGKRVRTNAESLIGETGIVIEPIDNLRARGRVVVNGQEWSARTVQEGETAKKDERVRVVSISGVKLMVERAENTQRE